MPTPPRIDGCQINDMKWLNYKSFDPNHKSPFASKMSVNPNAMKSPRGNLDFGKPQHEMMMVDDACFRDGLATLGKRHNDVSIESLVPAKRFKSS